MCRMPRKPSLQPWPSARLLSMVTLTLRSLRVSLSMAAFSSLVSLWLNG